MRSEMRAWDRETEVGLEAVSPTGKQKTHLQSAHSLKNEMAVGDCVSSNEGTAERVAERFHTFDLSVVCWLGHIAARASHYGSVERGSN